LLNYSQKLICVTSTALLLGAALASGSAVAQEKTKDAALAPAAAASGADVQTGLAAYYTDRLHGHRTASGQRYNRNALTTAHPSLPFGTKVRVTNVKTNKSVVVTVNDRGPTQAGRIVDVSHAAAQQLGMVGKGLTEVRVEVVR
jgi:rare lipoprotein A